METKVKYLGYHFNSQFTSEAHVNAISKNVNFVLSKIQHCRNTVNTNTKLQLVRGVIIPMFDYASIIYHGFGIHGSNGDETRLNVLMNSCVRFIGNLSGRDHVSEKYRELNLLNASNRRTMLICCFIYSFLITQTPSYLINIFTIKRGITRSGTDTTTLMVKKVHLTRDENQFAHCACKLWNNLPMNIRNSKTKDIFSNEIKNYLMNLQNH